MTLGCVLWAAQGPVWKNPQGWQGLSRAQGRAGVTNSGQEPAGLPTGAEFLLPQLRGSPAGRHNSSPSTGVQEGTEKKNKKGKGKRRKGKALLCFKPGCPSKSLGSLFPSLSSLILQPAQKGKQSPLEQTCQQQLYNRNNQTSMWLWLTRFSPQFYESSPLPTILTHNIQQ